MAKRGADQLALPDHGGDERPRRTRLSDEATDRVEETEGEHGSGGDEDGHPPPLVAMSAREQWQHTSDRLEARYQDYATTGAVSGVASSEHRGRFGARTQSMILEEDWLSEMLQEAVYTRVSDQYATFCVTSQRERPNFAGVPLKIKMTGYDQMPIPEEKPWVKRFKWFITRPDFGMTPSALDENLFVLRERNGAVCLWAVTYTDDVVYGGDNTHFITSGIAQYEHLCGVQEIGTLSLSAGLRPDQLTASNEDFHNYIRSMGSTEATHIKYGPIYHEALHWPNGFVRFKDEVSTDEDDESHVDGDEISV
jgi:hypothetical protein